MPDWRHPPPPAPLPSAAVSSASSAVGCPIAVGGRICGDGRCQIRDLDVEQVALHVDLTPARWAPRRRDRGCRPGRHGLVGMYDTVSALGGRLEIESPASGGTLLAAAVPRSAG
jgi:hypothetical protein